MPTLNKKMQSIVNHLKTDQIYLNQLFSSIPFTDFATAKIDDACRDENRHKNRYGNILAQDDTRVKLNYSHPDYSLSDYINASHISFDGLDIKYIATQAPLETSEFDFFTMIWEQNCSIIVALANPIEQNRVKGIPYWKGGLNIERELETYSCKKDSSDSLESFPSDFFVTLLSEVEIKKGKMIVRQLKMRNKDSIEKIVFQIHYIDWPDFGVPQLEDFDLILSTCRKYYSPGSPVITHCSAGVGRTGVFIAVDAVLQLLKRNEKKNLDLESDLIYDTIVSMRKARYGMVQTPKQLLAIYLAVEEGLEKGY